MTEHAYYQHWSHQKHPPRRYLPGLPWTITTFLPGVFRNFVAEAYDGAAYFFRNGHAFSLVAAVCF
jgi:hypothetical protein